MNGGIGRLSFGCPHSPAKEKSGEQLMQLPQTQLRRTLHRDTQSIDRRLYHAPNMTQDQAERPTPPETWKGHRACFECRRYVTLSLQLLV